jgi:hypothetical protein
LVRGKSNLEFIKGLMGATTWKREKKVMTIKCELFEHCRFIDNKDAILLLLLLFVDANKLIIAYKPTLHLEFSF